MASTWGGGKGTRVYVWKHDSGRVYKLEATRSACVRVGPIRCSLLGPPASVGVGIWWWAPTALIKQRLICVLNAEQVPRDCFKLYMSRIIAAASRAVKGTPLNQERRTLST